MLAPKKEKTIKVWTNSKYQADTEKVF